MADSSMSYLYTVGGYATLVGVGYVLYQVSTQKARRRAAAAQAKSARSGQTEPKKDDKKKKQRLENFAADSQESTAKAAKPRVNAPETSTFLSNAQPNDTSDDGVDNREFAKQLSKAKKGTQFAAKTDSGKHKEKSVKQSRANQIAKPEEDKPSAPSTTSADADDDLSPVHSPEPEAADAGGVADMLEPVPSGPSVLRLTGIDSQAQNKKKPAKAPEQVETKKQRQNRKKTEAAKAAREEAEKERKALEEKQRRTARIAEGRPAKDGSQWVVTNGNKSAWKQGAPNGSSNQAANDQLLETFEAPAPAPEAVQPAAPVAPAAPTSQSEATWIASLPSEEEQLEMLKDETDEWSTVKTKSKKSAKKETPVESGDDQVVSRPAAQPKQTKTSVPTNNASAKSTQSFGSFSALTSKDDPAEEAEEEWDV